MSLEPYDPEISLEEFRRLGRYDFCRKLVDYAQSEGVTKVFTFVAMATGIELHDDSRAIGVATDSETLDQLSEHEIAVLQAGNISGMNGILLGVVAERKMPGGCLLGEMPAAFVNVPYPKASQAVLEAFTQIVEFDIDLTDLKIEVARMDRHLTDALDQIRRLELPAPDGFQADAAVSDEPTENDNLSPEERQRIEQLFAEGKQDRAKAFELKSELDRLDVFREYEDRFLDLFKSKDQDES